MAIACDLVTIAPSLCIWQAYDSTVKADLFSSAILTAQGIFLVDPILLEDVPLTELLSQDSIVGMFVTNANHLRAAPKFGERFSAPILGRPESFPNETPANFRKVADGDKIGDELHVIQIDGAAAGEIVLYHTPNGGTLIVGDALINFEPYGFSFLPGKYCSNEKQMRRSLQTLLGRKAARMLFAHGTPILSAASERLKRLLDVDV
jgi:glyoxylase-like metal-dependent hydrolase (beta-lactamase superfamily II)